jgi:N-acetyl-beta-hexosaminidase
MSLDLMLPVLGGVSYQDVLSEMARLFEKSSYIHIGGDEVSTSQWSKSPVALEGARENNVGLSHLDGVLAECGTWKSQEK